MLPGIEIVARAASGPEALDRIAAVRPDLVLMDVFMPGMSGIETAGKVRQECRESKIVVLTLHNTADYKACAARAGVDGFVAKDELVAELPRVIDSLFAGRRT